MKEEFVIFVGNLTVTVERRLDSLRLFSEGRIKFGILLAPEIS
jgi:hypothetical protein